MKKQQSLGNRILWLCAISTCLLSFGCNTKPAEPKPLVEYEFQKQFEEADKIAEAIRKQFGCDAMACDRLNPEACVFVCFHKKETTDAALESIGKQSRIGWLILSGGQITDAGLAHLAGLNHLQILDLADTPISDTGLEHLKDLKELESLSLEHTRVTDEGVKKLQESLPNCEIYRQ
jgi:hypothetical protein